MKTTTISRNILDMIVDDLCDADVEWDGVKGTAYIERDYEDLHIAIGATCSGREQRNYIGGYLESIDMVPDGYFGCEVCELWSNSDDSVEIKIDTDYINRQLAKYFNY